VAIIWLGVKMMQKPSGHEPVPIFLFILIILFLSTSIVLVGCGEDSKEGSREAVVEEPEESDMDEKEGAPDEETQPTGDKAPNVEISSDAEDVKGAYDEGGSVIPAPESGWIVDGLIYVDFVPGLSQQEADAIIANHNCEIYEEGYFQSEDVYSYTLLVPEGSDEIILVEEFKTEPLVLRAGDYYWEKKIERMVDCDHARGEVLVSFVDGIDDGEALRILASHGYGSEQVERKILVPYPLFKVRFPYEGDDKDEMVLVIRDFLLDDRIKNVSLNLLSTPIKRIEGIIQVVFIEGVSKEDAEAIIATHGCEIEDSKFWIRRLYLLRVPQDRSDEEMVEVFNAEPLVLSARFYIIY
jgi:hypothetical protein